MEKIEIEINKCVANFLKTNYSFIENAEANESENYDVDDVVYTGITSVGKIKYGCFEVKSNKHFTFLDDNNKIREYYNLSNPNGIAKRLKFGNVPHKHVLPEYLPEYWENTTKKYPVYEQMPTYYNNKYVYIINAEDLYHKPENSKLYKMVKANAGLIYIDKKNILIFSPEKFKKAVIGYAWFLNKAHTEEYNKVVKPHYELKALIDLEQASIYPIETNNLFN